MRLRTFTAPDIHGAMAQIRETLGEDAVIISTTRDPIGKGVTVTAAIESEEEVSFPEEASSSQEFAPTLQNAEAKIFIELKAILAYHSVPANVADKLLDTAQMINFDPDATFEGIRKTLRKILEARFQFLPLPLSRSGFRLMLVGTPGVGKTMTIAKMAAQVVMEKKKVTVITTDTKRAGGIEQLQAFTDILGLELKVAETREDLKRLLQACSEEERVLIDSAGTNPYDAKELKELGEFLGIGNVEPVLTPLPMHGG
jgi:flagellar biosynthesis protein FlhF